jgi:hypothetical protein
MRKINLIGMKFSCWEVIDQGKNNKHNQITWVCKCDCGTVKEVLGGCLRSGKTTNCGCKRKTHTIHGQSGKRLYRIYQNMITRCYNNSTKGFKYYGGKGIFVCDEWVQDRKNFFKWALENGYEETLTLDRIDSNKDYSPLNCRWTTQKKQNQNKSNNHFITFRRQTKTLSEWSELYKINHKTILRRLEHGWDLENVFNEKPRIGRNQYCRVKGVIDK